MNIDQDTKGETDRTQKRLTGWYEDKWFVRCKYIENDNACTQLAYSEKYIQYNLNEIKIKNAYHQANSQNRSAHSNVWQYHWGNEYIDKKTLQIEKDAMILQFYVMDRVVD